jgi:hypothetical protein
VSSSIAAEKPPLYVASWVGELLGRGERDLDSAFLGSTATSSQLSNTAAGGGSRRPSSASQNGPRRAPSLGSSCALTTSDQMRLLEGQLNYLQDAAGRMGRIDWRNAVTGVLLGTIINAVLPGEVARDALLMLLRSVGHMFGHPIPELSAGL